jgi:predicted phosphodiesterase
MSKKILVISDTHLSHIFQPAKFEALKRIIGESDQVVLNGDFWEGYLTTFDRFVNSPWQELFPLLKERDTAYLYGNHDLEDSSDRRRDVFSTFQGDTLELESGGRTFHFQHGHRIAPTWGGDHPPVPRFLLGLVPKIEANGLLRREPQFLKRYQKYNDLMKAWIPDHLEGQKILLCGHSHLAELNLDRRYANSGVNKWGLIQYLIIEEGNVVPHTERY